MSEPTRLHPISTVLSFLKLLKELIIPFLIFFVFGGQGLGLEGLLRVLAFGLFLLFLIVYSFISWFRFTYRLEDEELRIEYGVFIRKKRYIPFDRIQSLDFSENILHQLFGLVKVSVETAGSENMEAEAVLTAITKEQANVIREILKQRKMETVVENGEERETLPPIQETVIYKITFRELLLLASTSGGAGVVITAVIAFISQFDEWLPVEEIARDFVSFAANQIFLVSILLFIGFLLAWIVAVIGMMLKYTDFTLKKTEKDLVITRGLLEKKQVTIPLQRIQGLRVAENLIRQPFGLATVYVISASTSADGTGGNFMILPVVKKKRVKELLEPHLDFQINGQFVPAPKRALRRYMFRGLIFVVPVLIVPVFFFKLWGFLGFLLLPIFAIWAYLKYKDAGWSIDGGQLSLRYRLIIKQTVYMKRRNIQSLRWRMTFFQKRKNLSTVTANIKSGLGADGGRVADLEKEDVAAIYQWFSRHA